MRPFISSFRRSISAFLALSILTSTIAMAAYLCPKVPEAQMPEMAMDMDMPCSGVDIEKPVHCATSQSATQLALEHLSVAPALTPPAIISVLTIVVSPFSSVIPTSIVTSCAGTGPPYLRTQRLRI